MIKRKILAPILLFFFTFYLLLPDCRAYALDERDLVPQPADVTVDATAAYLVDADTGDVLYAMNESEQLYPASTTKIMTCYLTLKYGNLNDLYTLPSGISAGMDENSSTSNLQPGEELYISELLKCLMISSANEAANALAIYISGSISDFVDLMNEEAAALGCMNTHFENPNGLHSEDHYTSAEDLALITMAALQYEAFRNICGTASTTIRATNLSEARTLENTNYLLPGTDFSGYDYEGAEGVKTGHTTPAGYCLVSLAKRNGHELLGVVLGASETTTDDEIQIGSFTESIRLLDWGYDNYETAIVYRQYLAEAENNEVSEATAETASDEAPAEEQTGSAQNNTAEEAAVSEGAIQTADSSAEALNAMPEGSVSADTSVPSAETDPGSITADSETIPEETTAQTAAAATDTGRLAQIAYNLQITTADLILLLAGSLILILLFILILICSSQKRKQVISNEL